MDDEIFPKHYEAWKRCITQKCKIDLTKEYVMGRLDALSQENSPERKKFVEKYGTHWTDTIISYFNQALREVG